MNTKLILTIERAVIEKTKTYAIQKGSSLSDIVENYLKSLTKDTPSNDPELGPITKSLKGSLKAPSDFDYKKELVKTLEEKYL